MLFSPEILMSGDVSHRKRLISIKASNIKNSHIYFSKHKDFFPPECFGGSKKAYGSNENLTLIVEGLKSPIVTDIATDKKTGNPRSFFFRKRSWVAKFFAKYSIKRGDIVALEKMDNFTFRIYPFENKDSRQEELPNDWPEIDNAKPSVIDLFAGCGGFSLGFQQAGFENKLAVEWDQSCCETFKSNINERIFNSAIQEVEIFPNCEVVIGGPPCQGFSNLGERVPNDPRRQLWRHFMRCVEQSKPLIFAMENVPPILKSAEYVEIKKQAEDLGYQVEGAVLNAADYGVPQQRKRAFIIGSLLGVPPFPTKTHRDPKGSLSESNKLLPVWKTVGEFIRDLPKIPDGTNWHIGRNPTATSLKRYACVPYGGNRFDLPDELKPECWKRKTKGGTDLFGRLWWDRPSVTIRTEFYKPEKGRYLHPEQNRPITHREAARLQGFSDEFLFKGKKIEVGIQIGNAVPPPLAYQVAIAIKKEIEK